MTPPAPLPSAPPRPARRPLGFRTLVGLITLTALPELLLILADWGLIGSARWRPLAWQYGGFWAGLLHGWRPNFDAQPVTMFLSYGVLHAGPGHMIGNVLTLIVIGPPVAARYGGRGLAAIWFASVFGGALAFGLISRSPAPMVGASGAIFGLAGAWTWIEAADRRRAGAGRLAVAARVAGIMAGLAGLNLAMWFALQGVLAWETHLGGYLAGFALAAAIGPRPPAEPRSTARNAP
jgi:membrane associated rhomboid family serine protease